MNNQDDNSSANPDPDEKSELRRNSSRKKRKNVEEIRSARALYMRQYRNNISEEQKERIKLKMRQYRSNLTEKQRQKIRDGDNLRKQRKILTLEQRAKANDYVKKYRARLTEAQIQSRKEYHREYMANLTEEQREERKLKRRIRWFNLTEAEREKLNMRRREKKELMNKDSNKTEELIQKQRLYNRTYYKNMSAEQRERIRIRTLYRYEARKDEINARRRLKNLDTITTKEEEIPDEFRVVRSAQDKKYNVKLTEQQKEKIKSRNSHANDVVDESDDCNTPINFWDIDNCITDKEKQKEKIKPQNSHTNEVIYEPNKITRDCNTSINFLDRKNSITYKEKQKEIIKSQNTHINEVVSEPNKITRDCNASIGFWDRKPCITYKKKQKETVPSINCSINATEMEIEEEIKIEFDDFPTPEDKPEPSACNSVDNPSMESPEQTIWIEGTDELNTQHPLIKKSQSRSLYIYNRLNLVYGDTDPLTEFIRRLSRKVRTQDINTAIEHIEINLYLAILQMLNESFKHHYFVKILIELLKHWYESNPITKADNYDLLFYILVHVSDVYKNYLEDVVAITCSVEHLKMMFFSNSRTLTTEPQYIYNWPFISMSINIPGFSMHRKMCNINDFFIAKSSKCIDHLPNDTRLHFKIPDSLSYVSAELILNYLNRLSDSILACKGVLNSDYKLNIIEAIREFQSDIKLCGTSVLIQSKYYIFLSEHTYVNKAVKSDNTTPAHFIQFTKPRLSFEIKDAELFNTAEHFNISKNVLKNIRITYKCENCNIYFIEGSLKVLRHHLKVHHCHENVWKCTKCNNLFDSDRLSLNRWKHECSSKLETCQRFKPRSYPGFKPGSRPGRNQRREFREFREF